mmetsp:Transcript_23140/g.40806  ORF Transcript_23140/g.40806 Transcript_23140/m.40806 type:complete len:127 (+) Transcript_23140:53-433(+)
MAPQATFVKVANIKPDSSQLNTIVKVVSSEIRLQCLGQPGRNFADVVVGDETGIVVLRAQGDYAQLCIPGAALVVRGARVEMFEGRIRLELGRWSRLSPIEASAAAFLTPNTARDISATDFALMSM